MIRCSHCGKDNPDNSEVCQGCEERLQSNQVERAAVQPEAASSPGAQASSAIQPSPRANDSMESASGSKDNVSRSGKQSDRPPKTGAKQKGHAKLIITRGMSTGTEFPLMGPESTIGRWDADNGVFPDIDLDRFDPESKISRRHARILLDEGEYTVEDLGSTNGTFINRGRRLLPGSTHPLHHGDELIIGKTFLKFLIES